MSFSPKAYWSERGKIYEQQAKDGGWWDGEQEHLADFLGGLSFRSVLELGCGFGRVGASIKARWPDVQYTGIDISPDLVAAARKRLPDSHIIEADMVTFSSTRKWDLVLAISALSHVPPEDIGIVVAKIKNWARRDIVVVDWNKVGGLTPYQAGHPFESLLGPDTYKVSVRGPGQMPNDGRLSMWHLPLRS